ncbi:MAG: transposase [Spirochaetaceae bacterium]|nr:transposase [Spirochaetaceae bacterium]
MEKTSQLIQRLTSDPNMRLICGFTNVPDKSSFSRIFSALARAHIMEEGLDELVKKAHEDTVVYIQLVLGAVRKIVRGM